MPNKIKYEMLRKLTDSYENDRAGVEIDQLEGETDEQVLARAKSLCERALDLDTETDEVTRLRAEVEKWKLSVQAIDASLRAEARAHASTRQTMYSGYIDLSKLRAALGCSAAVGYDDLCEHARLLIRDLNGLIGQRVEAIKERDEARAERDQANKRAESSAHIACDVGRDADDLVKQRDELRAERDRLIAAHNKALTERDEALADRAEVVKQRDAFAKDAIPAPGRLGRLARWLLSKITRRPAPRALPEARVVQR